MKLVVFGVAMVLAATGAAVAKEKKKVATAQAATSCSQMKAGSKPKAGCKSTRTVVAQPSNNAANFLDHYSPRLGYDADPWFSNWQ
jgi:ribosomal protein S11